ncbi:MAG TPA: pyridoxamine 5'-phosphate oxidase family protein [Pseudolysinimonas sp.]|nr:pyridoxamine 5'-phosphate oxidase family protein [Pseudolysinimonas sp.]
MDANDVLDAAECWRLLRAQTMGRLATATDEGPRIWPINFRVRGESLIFRSAPGTKVWNIGRDARVAFEVDGLESGLHWSVVVLGTAHVIDDDDPGPRTERDELHPVAPGPKPVLFRITPETVSGRRFVSALEPSPLWNDRPAAWRSPS